MHVIRQYQDFTFTKADEYSALVGEGLLTAEEAAQCLAGACVKWREENTQAPLNSSGDSFLFWFQLLIDQRLPGFNGLIPGRHI